MKRNHLLICPASPAALIHAAIVRSGMTIDQTADDAGMSRRRLRRIIDGERRVRHKDARNLARPLGRWVESLWQELRQAQAEVDAWNGQEAQLAKERVGK